MPNQVLYAQHSGLVSSISLWLWPSPHRFAIRRRRFCVNGTITCAITICFLLTCLSYADTCKYGLGYADDINSCSARESKALLRVAAAKTICVSGNSTISWSKNGKEPSWAWPALHAGESVAVKGFVLVACERADLVVKYEYDSVLEEVKLDVTDAESGDIVFAENRNVADLRSDAVRMAQHWHAMVVDARPARSAPDAKPETNSENDGDRTLFITHVSCRATCMKSRDITAYKFATASDEPPFEDGTTSLVCDKETGVAYVKEIQQHAYHFFSYDSATGTSQPVAVRSSTIRLTNGRVMINKWLETKTSGIWGNNLYRLPPIEKSDLEEAGISK